MNHVNVYAVLLTIFLIVGCFIYGWKNANLFTKREKFGWRTRFFAGFTMSAKMMFVLALTSGTSWVVCHVF